MNKGIKGGAFSSPFAASPVSAGASMAPGAKRVNVYRAERDGSVTRAVNYVDTSVGEKARNPMDVAPTPVGGGKVGAKFAEGILPGSPHPPLEDHAKVLQSRGFHVVNVHPHSNGEGTTYVYTNRKLGGQALHTSYGGGDGYTDTYSETPRPSTNQPGERHFDHDLLARQLDAGYRVTSKRKARGAEFVTAPSAMPRRPTVIGATSPSGAGGPAAPGAAGGAGGPFAPGAGGAGAPGRNQYPSAGAGRYEMQVGRKAQGGKFIEPADSMTGGPGRSNRIAQTERGRQVERTARSYVWGDPNARRRWAERAVPQTPTRKIITPGKIR